MIATPKLDRKIAKLRKRRRYTRVLIEFIRAMALAASERRIP